MAGYTRQSEASIQPGEDITAAPLNAEFDAVEGAFNGTTGHTHDGTTGNGPKIPFGSLLDTIDEDNMSSNSATKIPTQQSVKAYVDSSVSTATYTVNSQTEKTSIVDADNIAISDSAASNVNKKITWANIKATLKTYFDTLYQATSVRLTQFAGLSDPNADRIVFWDDSAGTVAYLTASTGLSISDTSISVTTASSSEARAGTANKLIDAAVAYTARSPVTLTDAATITPDFDAGRNFTVTLGGNRTLANPTNQSAGQSGYIRVIQDATGGRTLSYGTNWEFAGGAPTLSTAANAVDVIAYEVFADGVILSTFAGEFS